MTRLPIESAWVTTSGIEVSTTMAGTSKGHVGVAEGERISCSAFIVGASLEAPGNDCSIMPAPVSRLLIPPQVGVMLIHLDRHASAETERGLLRREVNLGVCLGDR